MKTFADFEQIHSRNVICDFICPTDQTRKIFGPDLTIWMDTIKEGRYEDTNKIFENPNDYDFRITEWNEVNHINLAEEINKNV
jgi:adenylylsulfate kinase